MVHKKQLWHELDSVTCIKLLALWFVAFVSLQLFFTLVFYLTGLVVRVTQQALLLLSGCSGKAHSGAGATGKNGINAALAVVMFTTWIPPCRSHESSCSRKAETATSLLQATSEGFFFPPVCSQLLSSCFRNSSGNASATTQDVVL